MQQELEVVQCVGGSDPSMTFNERPARGDDHTTFVEFARKS
jgi:hypothetical protein